MGSMCAAYVLSVIPPRSGFKQKQQGKYNLKNEINKDFFLKSYSDLN